MRAERVDLPIRIIVDDPIAGLAVALQCGQSAKAVLVPPASRSAQAVTFDLEVTLAGALADGRPRLLGPNVQGPPDARFVYLCVGRYAGQADSPFAGRVKIPLGELTWDKIDGVAPGERLTARISGRSPKGGPLLASVRLLAPGWV